MSEIERYVGGSPAPSFLARVPGTTAWDQRRRDIERQNRHEIELQEAAHRHAMEKVEIVQDTVLSRASVQGAQQIAETLLHANAAVADVADAYFRDGSAVRQAFILDAAAVVGPELNRVAASHIAHFRRN